MGNESSLPSEGAPPPGVAAGGSSNGAVNGTNATTMTADELQDQAKAPPSSSTAASEDYQQQASSIPQHATTTTTTSPTKSSERGPRAGARMIGAVFGKGNRGAVGQQQQQSPPPSSSSSPPDYDTHHNNNGVIRTDSSGSMSSNAYYDANMGTSQEDGVVSSHDYFAHAQQQNMQSHQQPPQQQPHNPQQEDASASAAYYAQQQQQTPSPLVAGSHQPQQQQLPQHAQNNHVLNKQASIPMDVNQKDHPAVGVMFEKTAPTPPAKKSIFPGRATARGAALISSMRNLTLGGAFGGGAAKKKEANDWEKQWDADEDDDSDESDEDEGAKNDAGAAPPQHHQLAAATARPPAMDVGHSELPLPHASNMSVASIAHGSSLPYHHNSQGGVPTAALHQQQKHAPMLAPSSKVPPVSGTDPHHDLASEWDMAGIQPPTAIEPDTSAETTPIYLQQQQQMQHQQQQQFELQQQQSMDKPNVQMFLPMLRVLGKGSFGKVVLVQKQTGKERGGLFAMKILRKTHLVKRRQIERTRTERKVLSVVNHPFIMKLHYAFQTPDKLYLVLDYCPGGELFFHLSRFRRFPERVARFYAAELLLAIGHLHKRGIIYRDLKPENVLLDSDGHVKLGDFGLAKAGIKHPCEGATSMCGTPEYMAPEVLAQAGHGFCVDYWGLGMLLYEMMTGLPPWYTTDRAKLFRRLKSAPLDVPSYFSGQAGNCVSALLERNPRRRLGVTGIRTSMEHEFFRNISWKSLYARRVEAPIRPCEGWKPPEPVKDGEDPGDGGVAATAGQSGPVSSSAAMSLNDIEAINPNDLEDATKNFDNTFTRMPVESEEMGEPSDSVDDKEVAEQLNAETFLGFSFDSRDRDLGPPVSKSPVRPRSHAANTVPYPSSMPHDHHMAAPQANHQQHHALE